MVFGLLFSSWISFGLLLDGGTTRNWRRAEPEISKPGEIIQILQFVEVARRGNWYYIVQSAEETEMKGRLKRRR